MLATAAVLTDEKRADVVLVERRQEVSDHLVRAYRDDLIALATDHLCDVHTSA